MLEIPAELLYVSVYEDDDEAYDIWTKEVRDRPVPHGALRQGGQFLGARLRPLRPLLRIYFDRGPEHGCGKPDCKVGCDCDRYMEVWNLVFSQFDSDGKGHIYAPGAPQH